MDYRNTLYEFAFIIKGIFLCLGNDSAAGDLFYTSFLCSRKMCIRDRYGKLSHKNLDDLQSGFRSIQVSGEDQKEDPLDFVLWKPKKEGEPYWVSPWSEGRPGWHIECSVMSKKYLGEEIDIHAGGEDLVSVSYTHLDVYKRQDGNGPRALLYKL